MELPGRQFPPFSRAEKGDKRRRSGQHSMEHRGCRACIGRLGFPDKQGHLGKHGRMGDGEPGALAPGSFAWPDKLTVGIQFL